MSAEPEVLTVDGRGLPLTVYLAQVDSRAGVAQLSSTLEAQQRGRACVAVLSPDLGIRTQEVLDALTPPVAELLCVDAVTSTGGSGHDLAMRALTDFGVGQDFVYQFGPIQDALDRALHVLGSQEGSGWEGEFLVVLGTSAVLDLARTHLARWL